jgi:hypothetical protein
MDNRISQTTVGTVIDRQTPRNDFGQMLMRGMASAASTLGAASAFVPGGGVITAAISQTAQATGGGGGSSGAGGIGGVVGSAPGGAPGSAPKTGGGDGLDAQKEMMAQNQKWTAQYLALQNDMQRESREFTAVSNVLKVRHESAKTAINNIR